MVAIVQRGKMYQWQYPAANYNGVPPRWETRHGICESIRDLAEQPIADWALQENPLLMRDGQLITFLDLDKGQYRSFYSGSMKDLVEIDAYTGPFEVVLCEQDSSPEVVAKAPTLQVAMAWLQEWIRDPLGLIVGLRRSSTSDDTK